MAGITLGADPLSGPFRHASAVFVPWSDAEAIALYQGGGPFGWRIGTIRASGSSAARVPRPCPRGNKPARRCPVPGVAAGAVRPVTAWRLDRDRLAALTAAVAPGIPIIDASTGPNQGVEGAADRAGSVAKTDPRIKRQAHPPCKSSECVRSFGLAWVSVFAVVRRDLAQSTGVAAPTT